jgi:hypothetical protein
MLVTVGAWANARVHEKSNNMQHKTGLQLTKQRIVPPAIDRWNPRPFRYACVSLPNN